MSATFGILDTQGNLWIGNSEGPILFSEWIMAQTAAQILETRVLGDDLGGRFRGAPFPASESMRIRDELSMRLTAEQAIRRIEGDPANESAGLRSQESE